jgi:O-antigen/teichoic acid export membrane protein
VPIASVRFVGEALARGDRARTDAAVSTCLGICLGLGATAALIGLALYPVFEHGYLGGALGARLGAEALAGARTAYLVVALQVAASFALRLPYGLLDAHHDFLARNAIMAGEILLRLGLTVAVLSWSPTLEALAAVQVVCALSEFVAAFVVLKRRHPALRLSLAAFDRGLVRAVLGFSVWSLLLNVGALLAFRIDVLVIGAFLPAEAATQYDVGNKFFEPLTGLMIAVSAVVMPNATLLAAGGRTAELRDVLLRWSKICLSIALCVGIYLLVLGPRFLGAWIDPRFEFTSGPVLQLLMLSFLAWLPVRGVAIAILFGAGHPRAAALALLAMGVVNLGLSVALVRELGILGVALGTAVPNVLFALHVLWLACRQAGVTSSEWFGYVTVRAFTGALVPLAFLVALREGLQPATLPALVACGVAFVLVFAATWVLFVYRGDRYVDLRGLVQRAWARGRGGAA